VSDVKVGCSGIIVHDGALLLVQRGRAPYVGTWSIPGGRVEFGETVRDTVAREVREETGLTVEVGAFAGWDEHVGDGHHFVFVDFFATVIGSTALKPGDDAADARWVPLADVAAYDLVPGLLDFLVTVGTVHA
jgi:ADP-ribose pyrophosphatase YjhB (NUDIX family)